MKKDKNNSKNNKSEIHQSPSSSMIFDPKKWKELEFVKSNLIKWRKHKFVKSDPWSGGNWICLMRPL